MTPDCRPRQLCRNDEQAIWKAENVKDYKQYVALFNLSDEIRVISISKKELDCTVLRMSLLDLWSGENKICEGENISCELYPHDCVIYQYFIINS